MSSKYCIGCKHLFFQPGHGDDACGSTMTGSWGAETAELACGKGHWTLYLSSTGYDAPDTGVLDIERAMQHANQCSDFEARVTPSRDLPDNSTEGWLDT